MVKDLRFVQARNCSASSRALKADARTMSSVLTETVDHIITSPPYPQEHDYTRTTRVELVLLDYIENMDDLRNMKKGMLRASTRNVYSVDNDYQHVTKFKSVTELVDKIDRRVKETKGTSGFEKLYAKLVGEYFGGMYRSLQEMFKVLKEGGTAAILVGDSHAFKMTHIETAKVLGEFALEIGFKKCELEVWLHIRSTAHNYAVPEYILELYK
jgi:DNA modification methylase